MGCVVMRRRTCIGNDMWRGCRKSPDIIYQPILRLDANKLTKSKKHAPGKPKSPILSCISSRNRFSLEIWVKFEVLAAELG